MYEGSTTAVPKAFGPKVLRVDAARGYYRPGVFSVEGSCRDRPQTRQCDALSKSKLAGGREERSRGTSENNSNRSTRDVKVRLPDVLAGALTAASRLFLVQVDLPENLGSRLHATRDTKASAPP